jgi:prepilin-type N-terminal cleavage/methylation domain-containing protein
MMKRLGKKGFTLVEIMIVVAIIALLAAIAIPNLLRARHNANESAAIGSLRTLSSSEESYRANQNPVTYGSLANLLAPPRGGPPYIDAILAGGAKQGYNFAMTTLTTNTYTITATPQAPGQTGTRTFTVDQTGVIFDVTNNRPVE